MQARMRNNDFVMFDDLQREKECGWDLLVSCCSAAYVFTLLLF